MADRETIQKHREEYRDKSDDELLLIQLAFDRDRNEHIAAGLMLQERRLKRESETEQLAAVRHHQVMRVAGWTLLVAIVTLAATILIELIKRGGRN